MLMFLCTIAFALLKKHQQNAVFSNMLMFFRRNCLRSAQKTSAKRRFQQFADVFQA